MERKEAKNKDLPAAIFLNEQGPDKPREDELPLIETLATMHQKHQRLVHENRALREALKHKAGETEAMRERINLLRKETARHANAQIQRIASQKEADEKLLKAKLVEELSGFQQKLTLISEWHQAAMRRLLHERKELAMRIHDLSLESEQKSKRIEELEARLGKRTALSFTMTDALSASETSHQQQHLVHAKTIEQLRLERQELETSLVRERQAIERHKQTTARLWEAIRETARKNKALEQQAAALKKEGEESMAVKEALKETLHQYQSAAQALATTPMTPKPTQERAPQALLLHIQELKGEIRKKDEALRILDTKQTTESKRLQAYRTAVHGMLHKLHDHAQRITKNERLESELHAMQDRLREMERLNHALLAEQDTKSKAIQRIFEEKLAGAIRRHTDAEIKLKAQNAMLNKTIGSMATDQELLKGQLAATKQEEKEILGDLSTLSARDRDRSNHRAILKGEIISELKKELTLHETTLLKQIKDSLADIQAKPPETPPNSAEILDKLDSLTRANIAQQEKLRKIEQEVERPAPKESFPDKEILRIEKEVKAIRRHEAQQIPALKDIAVEQQRQERAILELARKQAEPPKKLEAIQKELANLKKAEERIAARRKGKELKEIRLQIQSTEKKLAEIRSDQMLGHLSELPTRQTQEDILLRLVSLENLTRKELMQRKSLVQYEIRRRPERKAELLQDLAQIEIEASQKDESDTPDIRHLDATPEEIIPLIEIAIQHEPDLGKIKESLQHSGYAKSSVDEAIKKFT